MLYHRGCKFGGALILRLARARIRLQSFLFFTLGRGRFPPVNWASQRAVPKKSYRLLAVGGSLTEEFVLAAYRRGIFLLSFEVLEWVVFDPRSVLLLENMNMSKSLRRTVRSGRFRVTFDAAFKDVVRRCADRERSWLIPERIEVAERLHERGLAHSVEVWNQEGELVGGTMGIAQGKVFIAESTYHRESNAGNIARAYLYCHLQHWGYRACDGISCSLHSDAFGYERVPLREYLYRFQEWMREEGNAGEWKVDEALDVAGWDPAMPGSQV